MNRKYLLAIFAAIVLALLGLLVATSDARDHWWQFLLFGLLILGLIAYVVFTWMSERNRSPED